MRPDVSTATGRNSFFFLFSFFFSFLCRHLRTRRPSRMRKCILLGILASAPAWAFSAPGGLGARGWRGTRLVAYNLLFKLGHYAHVFICSAGECAASLSVQHKNLVHATRPQSHTTVLSLSATQNLAVDPEAAWAQYSASGGFLLEYCLDINNIRHMADFYMIGSNNTFQFLTWHCVAFRMGSCAFLQMDAYYRPSLPHCVC